MPTGAVFTRQDWDSICAACREADAWLLYDSAMERILFDGLDSLHPAAFPGMAQRTITVGCGLQGIPDDRLAGRLDRCPAGHYR